MAAVSTLILRSMRMTGEKGRGDTLDSNEQVQLLAELNTFMDACANERLLCYQIQEDTLTLTASTAAYTIGTNGTFNVTRPTKIVDPCFVRDASGYDSPISIINAETYGSLKLKNVGYTYPTSLFYDQGYSNTSTGTIYLYPVPSGGLTLHINSWKQLGTFANLSTQVMLPPGYQLFIESNFAIHSAAGVFPISQELAKIAKESKAAIKGLNAPQAEPIMHMDAGIAAGSRRSAILTGP